MATESSPKIHYLPLVKHRRPVPEKPLNKSVIFYINGDKFYKGHLMVISAKRFRNLDALLAELTRILTMRGSTGAGIPHGVRYILNLSGEPLESLDQVEDGKAYVCSSFKRLKRLNYGHNAGLPEWKVAKASAKQPSVQGVSVFFSTSGSETVTLEKNKANRFPAGPKSANIQPRNLKPRIIRVVRNGGRPRRVVKVLLNKRTAQTIDQILDEITSSVGAGYGGGSVVRRLYDTRGHQVLQISDLFKDETVFIAVGFERFKIGDIGDILNELENHDRLQPHRYHARAYDHDNQKTARTQPSKDEATNKQSEDRNVKNKGKTPADKISSTSSTPRSFQTSNTSNNTAVVSNQFPKLTPNGNIPTGHVSKDVKRQSHKDTNKVENKSSSESLTSRPQYKQHENKEASKKKEDDAKVRLPEIGNVQNIVAFPVRRTTADDSKRDVDQNNESNKADQENKPISNKVITKKESKKNLIENKETHSDKDKGNAREYEKKDESSKPENLEKKLPPKPQKVEDLYEFGRKLGDGNFAIVRIATHKLTKRDYAVKIIDKRKIKGKEKMIRNEIQIMKKCSHPNIIRLYENYDSPTDIYLIMEIVKGGDLFDAISNSVKFAEKLARSYVRDISKALHYLHKQMIVHRDMKPENLLVYKRTDGSTILKLADFGLAMKVEAPIFTICGTPTYVAPEILEERGYELKVDMWATGVITYIMLCGFPPFRSANRDQEELFDMIQEGDYEFVSPYWDAVSDSAKDLVSSLLVVDPKKRYSASDVLQHPWVRQAGGSRTEILHSPRSEEAKKKFKAAAIAVQSVKKFENLVEEFHHRRGEKLLV